jgi:hypothetical protein
MNLEHREKFWSCKKLDLEVKLAKLGKPLRYSSGEKSKVSKKDATLEELRLINTLSQEEIQELKRNLAQERKNFSKYLIEIQKQKEKIFELEQSNKSLTNLLIEFKSSQVTQVKTVDEQEFFKLRQDLKESYNKIKQFELQKQEIQSIYEEKIKNMQLKLLESEKENFKLLESVKKLENDFEFIENQHQINRKDLYEKLTSKNQELMSEIEALKYKDQSANTNSLKINELVQKINSLEEENLNLYEKIEIYEENQSKKLTESNSLQQLSFFILSKDKSSLDPEASNLLKKIIGENSTKLMESFQEKAFAQEQENKILNQRIHQEIQTRIENLEKIKSLQETIYKVLREPSIEIDINRSKSQIMAAKSALSSNFTPKKNYEQGEYIERNIEIEIIRSENKALQAERDKIKLENLKNIDLIYELQAKLNFNECKPSRSDLVSFIQCEAAALEDMIGDSENPEIDSDLD